MIPEHVILIENSDKIDNINSICRPYFDFSFDGAPLITVTTSEILDKIQRIVEALIEDPMKMGATKIEALRFMYDRITIDCFIQKDHTTVAKTKRFDVNELLDMIK